MTTARFTRRTGTTYSWQHLVLLIVLSACALSPEVLVAQERPAYLPERLSTQFATYREKPEHRAFALGESGAWGYEFGHDSVESARTGALANCRAHASDCVVIAVNDRLLVQNNPFSSPESGNGGWTYYLIPFMVLCGVISYVLLTRYKNKQGSDPDVDPIRERSFHVNCSADRVVQQAKRIAKETTELTLHDADGYTVILKTYPSVLSDGHFFWIRAESLSADRTKVHIQCRPRMFRFCHLFATRETNMVFDTLNDALSEHQMDSDPSAQG